MKLFHITDRARLDSILANGLDPKAEKATDNEEHATYLTSDYNFIIENDPEFWRDDMVLLEVDVSSLVEEVLPDPEYDYGVDIDGSIIEPTAFYTEQRIPPTFITVLGGLKLVPVLGAPMLLFNAEIIEIRA